MKLITIEYASTKIMIHEGDIAIKRNFIPVGGTEKTINEEILYTITVRGFTVEIPRKSLWRRLLQYNLHRIER
jgi:hypothetical protein